jgi:hypothetical protein
MWNVSVADMDVGYACLNVTGSKIGVETYSEGMYRGDICGVPCLLRELG